MLDNLLDIIRLQPAGQDCFKGDNMHPAAFRVYGGQVLAQAVSAALATVEDAGREIHSQHAYFLRPGNASLEIEYQVERARDGGSFSSRRVVALQQGKPILVSSMSFQEASRGDDYQPAMPSVPPPEELSSDRQRALASSTMQEDSMITTGEDLDVRLCSPVEWGDNNPREPVLHAWVKTNGAIPDERGLHRALLAYFSDLYLIDACLMAHGRSYLDPGMQVASLDHALWFHQACRADEWLLLSMEAERVGGGRGLARGRFFTREGQLVATTMQEGLMRFR
jgi:acyl-CoA thioesterase-2